jgi:peptide/nickel transport system ATP-binding protein
MTAPLLSIDRVSRAFTVGSVIGGTRLQALDDVSLTLDGQQPTILSVVGESGSGKTTLARIILRLLEPSAGAVAIDGKPVHDRRRGLTDAEFRRTVQPIFQNPFDTFSGRKPVDTYLYETARNVHGARTRGEATSIVAAALQAVGLDLGVVAGKYAYQFSGGELQRVSVARALVPRPRLIVADEPVSMIDASLRINIVNLFLRLKEEHGISFVYITHDLATAYYVSDAIAIMYRGSVVEQGPLDQVLGAPLHPYTELLLQSVPVFGKKWAGLIGLPDLETREYARAACKFAPRCPARREVCARRTPPRFAGEGGRAALCFRPTDYRED